MDLKLSDRTIVVIPNRRSEVRALFRTGDGQTTARRNGQSLFNDITEGERKEIDKRGGKVKKRRDMSCDYQVHLFKDHGESEFKRL